MDEVLLGLGSNVGRPLDNLREAVFRLHEICLVSRVSSIYRTEPVGNVDQDWFLNCAAVIETSLDPFELLDRLLRIETAMGRVRTISSGPRIIDIDILLAGERQIDTEALTVPHPRMHERAFALYPSAEIAAEMRHPLFETTVGDLLERLAPAEKVEKTSATDWPPRVVL
jgi:2-amino-4-hydroxy-6-hydroxymethyldihydropteridine diphosphokinase